MLPPYKAVEIGMTVSMEQRSTTAPDGDQVRAGRFMIVLANDTGETLTIGFDAFSSQLWLDRGELSGFSNPFFTKQFSTALTPDCREFSIRIVYDACTLEVFVNDGISVGTALVFPRNPLDRLHLVATNTGADIRDFEVYSLQKTMARQTLGQS